MNSNTSNYQRQLKKKQTYSISRESTKYRIFNNSCTVSKYNQKPWKSKKVLYSQCHIRNTWATAYSQYAFQRHVINIIYDVLTNNITGFMCSREGLINDVQHGNGTIISITNFKGLNFV